MASRICAACSSAILKKDYLVCSKCDNSYDLLCANLTPRRFNLMSKEVKKGWICRRCQTKIPHERNTVKSLNAESDTMSFQASDETLNITCRSKHLGNPTGEQRRTAEPELNLIHSLSPNKIVPQDYTKNFSSEELRAIVRNEFSLVFKEFQDTMFKKIDSTYKEITTRIEQVTDSMNFIEQKYEEIHTQIGTKFAIVNELQAENKKLQSIITDLTGRLSQMEQHSRANNVEIHNIPEHKSENLVTIVKQISNTTGYKLNESDIHLCTRVSKLNKTSSRPRSVLVKFSCPRVRDGFLASAYSFNRKFKERTQKLNTGHIGIAGDKIPIYIMEHLSPAMKALHAATRIKAKEKKYKYVWIKSGRIFVRKEDISEHIFIKNMQTLDRLN